MNDTVIIGAGPAGLAVAACLAKRGLSAKVLERGDGPAAALRSLDPSMRLLSPARLSRLPEMSEVGGGAYLSIGEYAAALQAYSARHGIDLEPRVSVDRVEARGAHFEVVSARASWPAKNVVFAAGMISTPRLPSDFNATKSNIGWTHSRDLRAEDLANGEQILVVGSGNSATEAMRAAHRRGARISLSVRGRMRSVPKTILGLDVHYLAYLPEKLPTRRFPRLRRAFAAAPAFSLPAVIAETSAEVVGAIRHYRQGAVELAGGRVLSPDRIVFATGFDFSVAPLGSLISLDAGSPVLDRCESTVAPGLFVIGAPLSRTFASGFLRGIASDARVVAARIEARA